MCIECFYSVQFSGCLVPQKGSGKLYLAPMNTCSLRLLADTLNFSCIKKKKCYKENVFRCLVTSMSYTNTFHVTRPHVVAVLSWFWLQQVHDRSHVTVISAQG